MLIGHHRARLSIRLDKGRLLPQLRMASTAACFSIQKTDNGGSQDSCGGSHVRFSPSSMSEQTVSEIDSEFIPTEI